MNKLKQKTIYTKTQSRKIYFKHVCEVGVYLPETSNVVDFIFDDIQTTLVEPDPDSIRAIHAFFPQKSNITLFPYAVYDYNGTVQLSKAKASTFISNLSSSPALVNDGYKVSQENTLDVECRIFSDLDSGDIDFLSIDIEGAEWYVLKNMKSLPAVLSIETHGKYYSNPFLTEINNWISKNNYEIWYKDDSDTVFIQKGLLEPTVMEKLSLQLQDFYSAWQKFKRHFYFWKK